MNLLLSFFGNKVRLIIEYAMLALLLAVAGFSLALWLKNSQVEEHLVDVQKDLQGAEDRIKLVEGVAEGHEQTIKDLKTLRLEDNKTLEVVLTTLSDLSTKDNNVREELHKLETRNDKVASFMDTDVPLDLQCVLYNSCNPATTEGPGAVQGGKGISTKHADKAVPAPN